MHVGRAHTETSMVLPFTCAARMLIISYEFATTSKLSKRSVNSSPVMMSLFRLSVLGCFALP